MKSNEIFVYYFSSIDVKCVRITLTNPWEKNPKVITTPLTCNHLMSIAGLVK